MSEPSSDTRKVCRCFRALAVLAVLAGGALVCVALAALMWDSSAGWREALPRPAMTAAQAEGATLRARYLHEAFVRPQLIAAGFGDASDALEPAPKAPPLSRALTDALWSMRAFPEVHDAMLGMLRDAATPADEKLDRFFRFGAFLDRTAAVVATGKSAPGPFMSARVMIPRKGTFRTGIWFAYYNADPRFAAPDASAPADASDYAAALNAAREILPLVLADLVRNENAQAAPAVEEQTMPCTPAGIGRHPADFGRAVDMAAKTVWKKRNDPSFIPLVTGFLTTDAGTPGERYAAVPLLAKTPGLPAAEYLAWSKDRAGLAVLRARVGGNPGFYIYPVSTAGTFGHSLLKTLEASPSLTIGGGEGPGIVLNRVDALLPGNDLPGNLYLLADGPSAVHAVPAYDLSRAYPIFAGMPLRHFKDQPLVLPLNPGLEEDRAVIAWYGEQGWKERRVLLFRAVGSPAEVARHWGSVQFILWRGNNREAGPRAALMFPQSGDFMAAALPRLKGRDAARFLGPVTALWFGKEGVGTATWTEERYMAVPEAQPTTADLAARTAPMKSPLLDNMIVDTGPQPEKKSAPITASRIAPIVLDESIRGSLGAAFKQQRRVALTRRLFAGRTGDAVTPAAVFAFADKALDKVADWGLAGKPAETAVEYLWLTRGDTEKEQQITTILSDTKTQPGQRLRDARRALGPAEKGASR